MHDCLPASFWHTTDYSFQRLDGGIDTLKHVLKHVGCMFVPVEVQNAAFFFFFTLFLFFVNKAPLII